MKLTTKARLLLLELELKAGHVRDTEYWQMPYGTPIVPGMKPGSKITPPSKPKKPTKVQKPKPPKHSAAGSRAAAVVDSLTAAETQKTPIKAKVHPPWPGPDEPFEPPMGDRNDVGQLDAYKKIWNRHRKTYEQRTSIPPRNSGDYEGMTAQEMWDDWEPEHKRFRADIQGRADKKTYEAIQAYTGSDYEYMNGLGRMDEVATADLSSNEIKETRKQIKDFDRAFRPVGKDILVHRVTTASIFQDLGVGSQFRDRGYTSTTVLEGYLEEVRNDLYNNDDLNIVQMEIRVPKEARALYVSALQKRRNRDSDIGEGELVLARGTEYRVVEKNGNTMVLEVVLPDSEDASPWDDHLDEYTQALYEQKLAEEEAEEEDDW